MTRKMAVIGLSYLIGLFCAPFFSNDILLVIGIGIALIAVIFIIALKRSTLRWLAVASAVMSVAFITHFTYERMIYLPITAYDGASIELKGTLLERKDLSSDMSLYIIRTNLNGHDVKVALYAEQGNCDYYDEVTVNASLYIPKDNAIFPQKYYYKSQGIFLFGNSSGEVSFTAPKARPLRYYLLTYADYIKEQIRAMLPKESGGLLIATLFGDKSALSEQSKLDLNRSGIGHITSVSGMHLAIVVGVITALLRRTRLSRKATTAILLTLVVAFVIFTGMNVTAIRCAIMITVYNLATLLRRRADSLSALGLAALILTIFSPYAARDTGMLLSILGVIGVGPVAGAINAAIRRRWKLKGIADTVCSAAVMSFGGSICTFPVLMLTFDEVSLIAPITNVLIIPASTIALVCAVMFAMIGGVSVIGTALCFIAGICMQFILWISNLMAGMTLAYVSLGSGYIVIWTLLTLTALIVAFIMLKSWSFSGYIGIAAVGVLLCSSLVVKALERDSLKISVMSDGIYGAVVCTSEEAAWVIKLGNGNDKLAKQIGDYLNLYDIDRIELLAMPTMRQSEAAVYSSRFDHFQIVSVVMPDEIMSSNPQLFEDSNKFIAQDMVISLDNGYNIDINWDGNNFDLLLYSDNFRLLCTQAANLSENTSLGQNDILVVTGKTKTAITLNSTPYSVVLNSKQVAHSNFGASIIYPFSEPRVEFKVYNDKVIKRRWGINVLY